MERQSWGEMKSPWSKALSENRYSRQALQNQLHSLGHWHKTWTWHGACSDRGSFDNYVLCTSVLGEWSWRSTQEPSNTTPEQIQEAQRIRFHKAVPETFQVRWQAYQGQVICLRSHSQQVPPLPKLLPTNHCNKVCHIIRVAPEMPQVPTPLRPLREKCGCRVIHKFHPALVHIKANGTRQVQLHSFFVN